jgi:arginyl-tRNA synthetase
MILPVHSQVRESIIDILRSRYGLEGQDAPTVALEYPPSRKLGDLSTPVAFELARRLRKAPKMIAQEIADALSGVDGVARVTAVNGYLNLALDRRRFTTAWLVEPAEAEARPGKAIVEHTAINPNKAAHIGHLRNAALGDTLVRALRFQGTRVEVQNYIDDTGVQVADVVVGFRVIETLSLDDIQRIADTTRFDHYCWDLYARVTEWYAGDKERLAIRAATLHDIEHGGNDNAAAAAFIADRIVRCHLATMARLNVDYQLLTWEGDILRLKFWARAFEVLKEKGAVYLRSEGRLAGCWVMPIQDDPDAPAVPAADEAESGDETEEREKVIVRSNGVVTYVGKDIAYQFWKLGLLGKDFEYRRFVDQSDEPLWSTQTAPGATDHPPFGGASYVYNVIDVRQSYLQKLLKQALIAVGHPEGAARSHHFSYEMVALSHATARELGFAPAPGSEDEKKPFVEVSGRKGLGVKADDLIDRLVQKALSEVMARNADMPAADAERVARQIAVAAVRYFLVKFSRGKIIAFDLDEALSFEGESGPYIQYAVVRARKILRRVQDQLGLTETALVAGLPSAPSAELDGANGTHDVWGLLLDAARLDDVVEQVIRTLEFSVLAKYAFSLAQSFNAFYHRASIVNEERDDVRRWRAAAVVYVQHRLTRALGLMGIEIPAQM